MPKEVCQSRSHVKVMLSVFFNTEGIVHSEFVLQNQTVNSALYKEFLKLLRVAIQRKKPERCWNGWILNHNKAPCHTSISIHQLLTGKNIPKLQAP
jgi:hypothetical protein